MRKVLGVLVSIVGLAVATDVLILNFQIALRVPSELPKFELGLESLLLLPFACLYLISKAAHWRTREWRTSFALVFAAYIFLKSVGVHFDTVEYLVAKHEGRTISGGAAMGHLFLLVFCVGPAQILSTTVFESTRFLKNRANQRDRSHIAK